MELSRKKFFFQIFSKFRGDPYDFGHNPVLPGPLKIPFNFGEIFVKFFSNLNFNSGEIFVIFFQIFGQ